MSIIINEKQFRKVFYRTKNKEELIKNNCDYNKNAKTDDKNINYIYSNMNYRKYSKDSSNLSTSNEDKSEKNEKTQNTNYNFSFKNNNKSNNNNFKGKASDFKIKYKTELCKSYEMTGKCKYGNNCAYAHGINNLRSKVTKTTAYRTKKCKQFFVYGFCPYGNRCQFRHQLKNNIVNNPYDNDMSYQKILEIISKFENVRNIKKLVEKPRLKIFKEITGDFDENASENKSRLLDDIKELDSYLNSV